MEENYWNSAEKINAFNTRVRARGESGEDVPGPETQFDRITVYFEDL